MIASYEYPMTTQLQIQERFLRAAGPVDLTHEEHGTITIPAGEYRVSGHHEAQPGELPRQVED